NKLLSKNLLYLCRFKIRVKYMPFNNKGKSRDGKSNRGGKPAFSRRAEGNDSRDKRFDDKKPHTKRFDKAPGKSFDAKKPADDRQRPYNKSTSSSSFHKKDDRPFNREDRPFRKDDRPFKKDDGFKRENKSYKKPEYKKDDR